MEHFVYILQSHKLNRFYIGETVNLENRLQQHYDKTYGKNKYTAKADDWVVYFSITCSSKNQAKAIERHIKKMKSKVYIQNLKNNPSLITELLAKY